MDGVREGREGKGKKGGKRKEKGDLLDHSCGDRRPWCTVGFRIKAENDRLDMRPQVVVHLILPSYQHINR